MSGQSLTNWAPTPTQRRVLECAQAADYEESVVNLCKSAGIARQTWYDYHDNPRFVEWWRVQFERHFGMQMPRVSAALLGRALGQREKGSDQAAKLLYERFDKGYAPRSRQDIAADVAVRKTYINVDTEKVTGIEEEGEE